MTVSVGGAAMSPVLTAHESAVTASRRTFGEMPEVSATVSLISAARATLARTAVFALVTRAAEPDLAAPRGDAERPSVETPSRHTSTAISTLTARLFNLCNLVRCIGLELTHRKG